MPARVDERLVELSAATTSPVYITDPGYFEPYARAPTKHLFVHREPPDGAEDAVEVETVADLARTDWVVHGFAITGSFTRAEFDEHVAVGVERVLAETPVREDDFPLSFFKVIAVDPDERSRGIGTRLGSTAVAPLFADPPVAVMAWLRDDPSNRRLVDQYARSKVATFPDYFPDSWACPDCGLENDCTCTVEMYVWFGDDRDRAVAAATGAESA